MHLTVKTTPTSTSYGTTMLQPSPIEGEIINFKKAVKKDPAICPILKDIMQWETWKIMMLSYAEMHKVAEVFNSNYSPSTTENAFCLPSRTTLYVQCY